MHAPSDGSADVIVAARKSVGSAAFTSDGVSGASRRLRALAALSGSLTDALGQKDAAALVEEKALSALGATSAVITTLGPFPRPLSAVSTQTASGGENLHLVEAIGLPDEVKAALEALPLDAPVLTWAEPRIFDEDERAFVLTLGVMCAQAIMRAHLRDAERESRQKAEIARETAEHANRSKADFVATISHELRTPMNAVLGYTALMADEIYGPVSPLQQEHIGRVRTSGYHLLGLIEDLLSYARVEAGQEHVHAETVQLVDVVDASLVLVQPLADRKHLHIRVERPAEPIALYTDPRKVRQILVNLLANAVKFTDAGEIVLVLHVEGVCGEVRVFFEVTDPGRGMAPEQQVHMFEPFWQADERSMKTSGSSGLGLSVARQLARLLGGDVTVSRSAPGLGSTFVLSLPAIYVDTANLEARATGSPL